MSYLLERIAQHPGGCERKRGQEIAELAVDLAIVALQLDAPNPDTRTMSRLDARRGTSLKHTLSETHGRYTSAWTLEEPGMALKDILQKSTPVFTAIGNVVRSFASGSFRLPMLEQAWCDSAYWFHQALGESIDAIAVAKLETALEVLLRFENSKGSERRVLDILDDFFNVAPHEPMVPGDVLSAHESARSAHEFARSIVHDRSRILHGTLSTLNTGGIDRHILERFVARVLRAAVVEIEAHVHSAGASDGIDALVRRIRQRKKPM